MHTAMRELAEPERVRSSRSAIVQMAIAGLALGLVPSVAGAQDAGEASGGEIQPPPELVDESGFPEVQAIADLPDAQDGTPFEVRRIRLEYVRPELPGLPTIEELNDIPFQLIQTPEGLIGPRPGLPSMELTLGRLSDGQARQIYPSAVRAIGAAIVEEFRRRNIVGVKIEPIRGGQTEEGDLTLQILVVIVGDIKTIASGDRIAPEQRVNSPKHARILRNSPIKPFVEGQEGPRSDVIRRDVLDEYAIMLSRHPGRRVDVAVAQAGGDDPADQDKAELQYLIQESKQWTVYAQLSNTGTRNTDEWRERFGFIHNQLTNNDDSLSLEYVTAGFESSHAIIGSYESRLGGYDRLRWRVSGTYNEYDASDVGVFAQQFTGEGWTLGGDLIWNFYQNGNLFLDLVGGVRYEHIEVANVSAATSGEDDLFVPHVGIQAEKVGETSSFFGSLNLEWTVSSISGATASSLEQLGRLGPDKDWYVLQWDLQTNLFLEPLFNYDAWSDPTTPESSTLAHELLLAFRGQYAFDHRLIPNAEQVVGGLYTVRGYDESSSAGDTTWVGTIEYRFHLPRALAIEPDPQRRLFGRDFKVRPQQVYGRPDWDLVFKGFIDVGQTYNSDRRSFEKDETLVGAGVGVEFSLFNNLSFRTDWGVVLDEVGDGVQEVGDNRLHVVLTILF
ncbi:MAG: hypothetical protein Kow0022_17390 [Phycisphaerales bacterium]